LEAGLPVMDIETLVSRAESLTGKAEPIEYDEQIVGYIRYRDGSVIDVIRKVKSE
jgi:citrate lyase subunit alpha/citrate CoA-transferase